MSPSRQLDQLWREASTDREMRRLIEGMAEDRADVRAMTRSSNGLSEADVRDALRRLKLRASWRGDDDPLPVPIVAWEPPPRAAASTDQQARLGPSPAITLPADPLEEQPNGKRQTAPQRQLRTTDLFDLGLLTPGQLLRTRGREGSEARVINGKMVEYQGDNMSFGAWGCAVTGWTAIRIYTYAETEDGSLLGDLRSVASTSQTAV